MITHETRGQSYSEVLDTLGKRQMEVLRELSLQGVGGTTASELALVMHRKMYFGKFERNNVHPRLHELVEKEVVEIVGKRRCDVSGKTCALYRVKQQKGGSKNES